MKDVFDPGLQPERTLLAWRRTSLSIAVIGAASIRFGTGPMGPLAITLGLICIALAATAYFLAAHRYARTHHGLTREGVLLGGGLPHLLLSTALVMLGLLGAVFMTMSR